jgi:hypothetical protein
MKRTGPGKIRARSSWRWDGDTLWAEPSLLLENFDIDGFELKKEHADFLDKQAVFELGANSGASVTVVGTASLSGESNHNDVLSDKRAKMVKDYLISKGVTAAQFKPSEVIALGDAPAGPAKEDERDRSVTLHFHFPLKIDTVRLYTDDWTNALGWDDIVGLDRADDGKSIDKINIKLIAWGAPKLWVIDKGVQVPVMPADLPVRLRSRGSIRSWSNPTILLPKFMRIPIKDPARPQFANMWVEYRLSLPIGDAGNFMTVVEGEFREAASVVRSGGTSDVSFRSALGWAPRGIASQNAYGGSSGSENEESPDALRLFQAGGVEVLEVESVSKADPRKGVAKRLIRNPADVFYYAGAGKGDGCLAVGKDCWLSPQDLKGYWKVPFDLEMLILAGCSVLSLTAGNGAKLAGPGAEWAKLLKAKGGPLSAIMGYRDEAPADIPVGNAIAARMGAAIRAGLNEDQWVPAWLQINADHSGQNTWNAVGMDANGYWWIEKRGLAEKGLGPPKKLLDKYKIQRTLI